MDFNETFMESFSCENCVILHLNRVRLQNHRYIPYKRSIEMPPPPKASIAVKYHNILSSSQCKHSQDQPILLFGQYLSASIFAPRAILICVYTCFLEIKILTKYQQIRSKYCDNTPCYFLNVNVRA